MKADVRSKIMEVTSRLFYNQGYNSTGINQIIEEAGIAKASLYHHFPSKTDLLQEYLEETGNSWTESINSQLAGVTDPGKKILALFDLRLKKQTASRFAGCQFIKISSEVSKADQQTFAIVRAQKSKLKNLIKGLVKQLPFDKGRVLSPDELADSIYLLLEAGTVSGSIFHDNQDMIKARKIVEKLM